MSRDTAQAPEHQSGFGEKYKLDRSKPLPEFSTPGGDAFVVQLQEDPHVSLYGVVQHPSIPVRNDVYKALHGKKLPCLICPKDRGVMNVGGKQRLVTVFERPTGGVLIGRDGTVNPRLASAAIRKNIAVGLLQATAALHKLKIVHRSIMPTRVYYIGPDKDDIVLGECCTVPPGYHTQSGMEPLEVVFADAPARGKATPEADFYQIGATLQSLSMGSLLYSGRDELSLLTARVNQSSYWALSGGQDISGTFATLVRSLMADDLSERWNAEDMVAWFEGVTTNKRTPLKASQMNRPTTFLGTAYVDRRLFAHALAANPEKAVDFLRTLDFPVWVQMALREEVLSDRIEKQLVSESAKGISSSKKEDMQYVAKMCMFLHPDGPIRYNGLSVSHDGIEGAVIDAYARNDKEKLGKLAELLDSAFLGALVEISGKTNPMFATQVARMKTLCGHAANPTQLSRGMERVLYEMNPALPCVSQKFENVWIGSVKQLLLTLERMAKSGGGKNILFDRHVAAFCARHGGNLERDFNQLAGAQNDPSRFSVLAMDFFGKLQSSVRVDKLPHLTDNLVSSLGPMLKRLKSKKRRESVEKMLEKAKKSGDIAQLTSAIDLAKIVNEDAREFAQARAELRRLDREKARLSRKITYMDPEAQYKGIKGARIAALVTLALTFTVFVMI